MQPETHARIKDLRSTLSTIEKVMDLDVLRERARRVHHDRQRDADDRQAMLPPHSHSSRR